MEEKYNLEEALEFLFLDVSIALDRNELNDLFWNIEKGRDHNNQTEIEGTRRLSIRGIRGDIALFLGMEFTEDLPGKVLYDIYGGFEKIPFSFIVYLSQEEEGSMRRLELYKVGRGSFGTEINQEYVGSYDENGLLMKVLKLMFEKMLRLNVQLKKELE